MGDDGNDAEEQCLELAIGAGFYDMLCQVIIYEFCCTLVVVLLMVMFVVVGELQDIRDILRYVSHSDPQLKGNTAVVIGHLLRAVLTEGRGNFDKWVQSSGVTRGQQEVGGGWYTQLQFKT